jgi:hypothetical protein
MATRAREDEGDEEYSSRRLLAAAVAAAGGGAGAADDDDDPHATDSFLAPSDIHVLLVDDEPLSRLVVGNLLRKCSYRGACTQRGSRPRAAAADGLPRADTLTSPHPPPPKNQTNKKTLN